VCHVIANRLQFRRPVPNGKPVRPERSEKSAFPDKLKQRGSLIEERFSLVVVVVSCPACGAGVTIRDPESLALTCYACGHEFQAEGHKRPARIGGPPSTDVVEIWPDRDTEPKRDVLTFCPMCGELAAESAQACPACGEPLPDDRPGRFPQFDSSTKQARRFRRQAQLLGVLWIFLAFLLAEHDFWLSERRVEFPAFLSSKSVMIPPIPLLSALLIAIAAFALVGKFWAVAVGGLLNYLLVFFMVWQPNVINLIMLAGVIVLTHLTLNQAASAR
jgi:hypothetical protein